MNCIPKSSKARGVLARNLRSPRLILVLICILLVGSCSQPSDSDFRELGQPYDAVERKNKDIRLFNEIMVRHRAWPSRTREMRYELINKMSEEGYELASLALKLLDFRLADWQMPLDEDAYKRLKELAVLGDASSMCLLVEANKKWQREPQIAIEEYVRRAAEQGNPACMVYRAGQLESERNFEEARNMRFLAAKSGSNFMQLRLVKLYGQGRKGYPKDLARARCWFEIAKNPMFDTGEASVIPPLLNRWAISAKEAGGVRSVPYGKESWCEDQVNQLDTKME